MRLAKEISSAFSLGGLDLSARQRAPAVGWSSLPEVELSRVLKERGESPQLVRRVITFLAAMDRARDADELWRRGLRLHAIHPWTFEVEEVNRRSLSDLADALKQAGVSQRHLGDYGSWRRIAESLAADPTRAVARVIEQGLGTAGALLADLASTTSGGTPSFPYLAGPKIGPMWVRMMAFPGDAAVDAIDEIPVAVDVQVQRVTKYLGVAPDHSTLPVEKARGPIQSAWRQRVAAEGVDAPGQLANTAAGLDPALWFFAKWGCKHCEPRGYRVPIHEVCSTCSLPAEPAAIISLGVNEPAVQPAADAAEQPLIALVGCVKRKAPGPARAGELYESALFRDRRGDVETRAARWFILSAKYGLVEPEDLIEWYDLDLSDLSRQERREWAAGVLATLRAKLGDLAGYRFEVHAGQSYFDFGLEAGLVASRAAVNIPTRGLAYGLQRQYYIGRRTPSTAGVAVGPPAAASGIPHRAGSGAYAALRARLESTDDPEVLIPFTELEALLGRELPDSARNYAPWWSGQRPHVRSWTDAGWKATPRLESQAVLFRRAQP